MVTGLSHLKQHGYAASETQAGQANVCGFKKKILGHGIVLMY